MPPDPPPTNLSALRDSREQAIAQLSDAFAHDLIEVDEFERRLTLAHRASSVSEITQLVSDLAASAHATARTAKSRNFCRGGRIEDRHGSERKRHGA
jgi:hypothetical protein